MMQFSERGRVRSFSPHGRFEPGDFVEDRHRQKRDRDPSNCDPGARRIAFPPDVFGRRAGDDQHDRKDSEPRESPQRRSENRTRFSSRQRLEERRRDQRPQNDAAADPESEADLIQEIDREVRPVWHTEG